MIRFFHALYALITRRANTAALRQSDSSGCPPAKTRNFPLQLNRSGKHPDSLKVVPEPAGPQFVSAVGDDSITRFDKPRNRGRNHGHGRSGRGGRHGRSSDKRGN